MMRFEYNAEFVIQAAPLWQHRGSFMSAMPMFFGSALTLVTLVLVIMLARFNSRADFIYFSSLESLSFGVRVDIRVMLSGL